MPFSSNNLYSVLAVRKMPSVLQLTYPSGYSYLGESHEPWELSYIISGSGSSTSNDKVYNFNAGDIVLHAPNQFHTFWVPGDIPCEIVTLTFEGVGLKSSLAGQYSLNAEEKRDMEQILNELPNLFSGYNTEDFSELKRIAPADDVGFQIIKNRLELLLLSFMRRGREERGLPSDDPQALCYVKISGYLRDNINRNLSMSDISREVYESPGKIKKIFRKYTGGGVIQHFNYLRCEYIMRLLSDGKSVKDIAESMNFSSPYYLSYFFKRETGMTAREYLQSLKKHKSEDGN